jgi:hypothetical protein
MTLSIMTLIMMAEHCYAECPVKALYAECRYVKCRYAECRGAIFRRVKISRVKCYYPSRPCPVSLLMVQHCKLSAFVTAINFHPSLTFASKAGAYMSEAPCIALL